MELPNTNTALTYGSAPRPPLAAEPGFPPSADTHQPEHQASQLGSREEAASLKHAPLFSFPDRRLVFEPSAHVPEEDILPTHRTDAPWAEKLPKQTVSCQLLLTLVLWDHPWLRNELSALVAPSHDASQQDWGFLLRGCPNVRVGAEISACSGAQRASQGDLGAGVEETRGRRARPGHFWTWSSDVVLSGEDVT